ncbi:preprotein translocase subunit SecG [Mucilaginibacter gynuensis]|uniref:Protein-export membrane protein SecG n=1 Tax=Mucilaginibacter gynuensis TaxID=1302236 RepID=A0ABP8GW64_9SPHI
MYLVLSIIAIIVCILLGLIVLIQNPKGGGLASNFSSSSQLMGVQKTGDFLEKGTWVLAITVMILSLAINVAVKGGGGANATTGDPDLNKQIENASKPTAPVAAPQSFPAAQPKAQDTTKK